MIYSCAKLLSEVTVSLTSSVGVEADKRQQQALLTNKVVFAKLTAVQQT